MDSWHKQYIFDYWDSRTGAIATFTQALRDTPSKREKQKIVKAIGEAIEEGVSKLSENDLMYMAVTMVEDLYKAADSTEIWDEAADQYLRASAGTFTNALAKRGYLIHYLVDNSFENSDIGMQRPLELYPAWFGAIGFIYICPQKCALLLMQSDGVDRSDYIDKLPRYIEEARYVANSLAEQCHLKKRHYAYLDTDSVAGTFDKALTFLESPGIITVCRDSAPATGSKVAVTLPKGPMFA